MADPKAVVNIGLPVTSGDRVTGAGCKDGSGNYAIPLVDSYGKFIVNTRGTQSIHTHLDGTTAYTDQSVIADPGDGFQAVITSITFSSGEAIAINFFLEEGSTKIFGPIYIEAVAGRGFTASNLYIPCTASTAVTLTTSAANDQSFDLDYFIQAI